MTSLNKMPNYRSTTEDKLVPLKSVIHLNNAYIYIKISLRMSQGIHCIHSTKTIRLRTLREIIASIIILRTSLFASSRIPHSPNHDISYHKVRSARKVANKLYLIWVYERGDVDSSLLARYTASFR